MRTSRVARARLLVLVGVLAGACGSESGGDTSDGGLLPDSGPEWLDSGSELPDAGPQRPDSGADLQDGSVDAGDAHVEQADCDGQPVGTVERRKRYQSEMVAPDQECLVQDQTRTCEPGGTWSGWSGDYAAESCVVDTYGSCDGLPHGSEQTRERYELPSVPFGSTCNAQTQTRRCEDGAFSDWSGSFESETCIVEGAKSCDGKPHGTTEERSRFQLSEVPFGSQCQGEVQTRSCDDGTWSAWTGSFEAENCRVIDALSCGNVAHEGSETRTRYEASLVPADQTCNGEEQVRTCSDGQWSDWSGSFTAELCDVEGQRRCGDVAHGADEQRLRYQEASVPFGSECVSEQQARTCTDGSFGEWSGSFTVEACEPEPPAPCESGSHGAQETRTRYASAQVPYGASCEGEQQQRTCNNGSWSDWSGSFTVEVCAPAEPADCEDGAHGSQRTRERFEAAVVPFGQTCVAETQTSTCDNGSWSAWSGSFSAEACAPAEPADCEGGLHGATDTRDRYQSAVVPFGQSCQRETQERTCHNGTWSAWSGTFAAPGCTVALPAACEGGAHGATQERTRYAEALVPAGSECVAQQQTRSCSNGTWSAWSGNYTAETCRQRARSCTDFTSNTQVLDGDSQSRVRYAENFPAGSCQAETQTRTCNDGSFTAWSGSYVAEGCGPLPAPSSDVASCRITVSNVTQCIEFRGELSAEYETACVNGTWDATRGCPTGGSAFGRCVHGTGENTSANYWYAPSALFNVRQVCNQQGGTWSDL